MPEISFTSIQVNLSCCSRRRNRDIEIESGTDSSALINSAVGGATGTDSITVADIGSTQLSRAKSRWLQATLAIVLRNRLARAWVELGRRARHNKRIGIADPDVSRRWGQLGVWLRRHQL